MDGTLLRPDGSMPDGLWALLERLRERKIAFASGRQLATLQRFAGVDAELDYIAENGAYVVRGDAEVSSDAMDPVFAAAVVAGTQPRRREDGALRAGLVVCGKRSAYIEDTAPQFVAEVEKYYARLEVVPDLLAVSDQILKLAIFDIDGGEAHTAPAFADLRESHQVVVSGRHWVDIMTRP